MGFCRALNPPDDFQTEVHAIPSGDRDRIGDLECKVFDLHRSLGVPQPQSWPQPDFFFGSAKRIMKIIKVIPTMPAAVSVCQSMLESDQFADLENSERRHVGEPGHENELADRPFPRS